MSDDMLLTSLQNPRIKQVVKLRDRREREKTGQFLIEGFRELSRALEKRREITYLFLCPSLFLGENEGRLIEQAKALGAKIFICQENVFRKISYRDRPDGILAQAPQKHLTLADLSQNTTTPLFVVAEAIEKPGNLGTILRSSDASGVDALLVCDRVTDIHNPNVVRASVGTLFTVPVVEASSQETFSWLKKQGVSILAATPSGNKLYTEANMAVPVAIVVGTEQFGLSPFWMEHADQQVRIPMLGRADSLNVATATTLLLFEAVRQRQLA